MRRVYSRTSSSNTLRLALTAAAPTAQVDERGLLRGDTGWWTHADQVIGSAGGFRMRRLASDDRAQAGIYATVLRVNVRWVTPLGEETASTS